MENKLTVYRVSHTPKKGRGIYASTRILPGEVIAVNHLAVGNDGRGIVERYCFEYDDKYVAMALGDISLTNHSASPNAEVHITEHKVFPTATLLSKSIIEKDEEITINYGYEPER